jgi:hypothetical protein
MADEPRYGPPPPLKPGSDRLERYREPIPVGTLRFGAPASHQEGLSPTTSEEANGENAEKSKLPGNFEFMLLSVTKELVFDIDEDGTARFYFIVYAIDEATQELTLARSFEMWGEDEDDPLRTLALAITFEVPVFPRNDRVAPELARYQARLHAEGVSVGSGEERTQYVLTTGLPDDVEGTIERLGSQTFITPADAALAAQRIAETVTAQAPAAELLARLRAAIEELEDCLQATARNESVLQATLTRYPILFGVNYREIIPKHRLGAEYEMDYALVQQSGLIDLAEIEASSHKLFTQAGNPRAELVHAEQQVLDWLSWIEDHMEYARAALPGIARPVGYIVIGRSQDLSAADAKRLERRNLAFRGSLEILTYDDLLARAQSLLRLLTSPVSYQSRGDG